MNDQKTHAEQVEEKRALGAQKRASEQVANKAQMDEKLKVATSLANDPNLDIGLVANLRDLTQKPAWNATVTTFNPEERKIAPVETNTPGTTENPLKVTDAGTEERARAEEARKADRNDTEHAPAEKPHHVSHGHHSHETAKHGHHDKK